MNDGALGTRYSYVFLFLVHVRRTQCGIQNTHRRAAADDIMLYEVGYYFSIYYLLVHSSIFIHSDARQHDTRRAHHEPNEGCDEIIKRIIMRHRVGNTDAVAWWDLSFTCSFTSVTSFNRVSSFRRGRPRWWELLWPPTRITKDSGPTTSTRYGMAHTARTSSPIECSIFSDLDLYIFFFSAPWNGNLIRRNTFWACKACESNGWRPPLIR